MRRWIFVCAAAVVLSFRVDDVDVGSTDSATSSSDSDVQAARPVTATRTVVASGSARPATATRTVSASAVAPAPASTVISRSRRSGGYMALVGTQQSFMESMTTNMYRGVPQNLLIARRCRSFSVTVNFGGSSALEVNANAGSAAAQRRTGGLAQIGDDVSSKSEASSGFLDSKFREGAEHATLHDRKTVGFQDGDEVTMKISNGKFIVETLHHEKLANVNAGVLLEQRSYEDMSVEDGDFKPNSGVHAAQNTSHQSAGDALMDEAHDEEDDNFDELASRLKCANELREATENTTVKCQMSGDSVSNVSTRLVRLRQQRHKMNEACNLPRGIPCYVALGDIVCQGPPHDCRLQAERMRKCCFPQIAVEREIRACQAKKIALQVANDPSLIGSSGDEESDRSSNSASTLEDSSGTTHQTVKAELARKKKLLRKQHLERRTELQKFWKTQEDELYNWKQPHSVSQPSVLEEASVPAVDGEVGRKQNLLREQSNARREQLQSYWKNQEEELYSWKPPANDSFGSARGTFDPTLIDTDTDTDTTVNTESESTTEETGSWTDVLTVQFAAMDTDTAWKSVWTAQAPVVPNSCTGYSCDYRVTIPCTAVVGRGVLSGRLGNRQSVELGQRILVIFDPWGTGDEFYANLTRAEKDSSLFKESGGIWAAGNSPIFWTFGQFSEPSWQLAMLLLDDIPLNQRGMGARVVRWITYFIPTILQGRWCSPPKCFDDGTRPWAWQSSLPIFQQYLRTRQPVKYAQCWIFAGCATSIYRAMGVAARTISNYNSAHGSTKNNGGVESFYFYGNDYQLSARSIPQNSIWTFHVWTEVYMKRLDLSNRGADGWQVADATPQEEACVPTPGGQSACRFMMGPASVNMARLGPNSADIRDPYDTRFLVGETVGSLRSWRPKYINWRTCPSTCARNSIGDGNCDAACNVKHCDWDMGDCCPNTCAGMLPVRPFACGGSGYSCKGVALGWTMLYLPDRTFIGRSLTTQRPGGAWNQPMDITRNYKVV